jgi:Fe2+ transport system protein B
VITFADRAPKELPTLTDYYQGVLGVPVAVVNARTMTSVHRSAVIAAIVRARALKIGDHSLSPRIPVVEPASTVFEHPRLGPWCAVATIAVMFTLPVYAAYEFASWAQPIVDRSLIAPVTARLEMLPAFAHAALCGSYGVLTLGSYSFLWAFPVVALIGATLAWAEETGAKDRISAALDPWLRRLGLSGRDLVPVLTGFGCNVVAVFQSRSCSRCTRRSCVSLIAFGSACSYQIGCSLSLFSASGRPWLFAPYLVLLCVVGALHTRLWYGKLDSHEASALCERAFLQGVSWRAMWWRLKAVMKQFLLQAMPIFLGVCTVGASLEHFGLLRPLGDVLAPVMELFGLPAWVAVGVVCSVIRKDGLLVLNQEQGELLRSLGGGQILVLVYLASTLTACVVTVWTIRRELGLRSMASLSLKQAVTALASTGVLSVAVRLLGM